MRKGGAETTEFGKILSVPGGVWKARIQGYVEVGRKRREELDAEEQVVALLKMMSFTILRITVVFAKCLLRARLLWAGARAYLV